LEEPDPKRAVQTIPEWFSDLIPISNKQPPDLIFESRTKISESSIQFPNRVVDPDSIFKSKSDGNQKISDGLGG